MGGGESHILMNILLKKNKKLRAETYVRDPLVSLNIHHMPFLSVLLQSNRHTVTLLKEIYIRT